MGEPDEEIHSLHRSTGHRNAGTGKINPPEQTTTQRLGKHSARCPPRVRHGVSLDRCPDPACDSPTLADGALIEYVIQLRSSLAVLCPAPARTASAACPRSRNKAIHACYARPPARRSPQLGEPRLCTFLRKRRAAWPPSTALNGDRESTATRFLVSRCLLCIDPAMLATQARLTATEDRPSIRSLEVSRDATPHDPQERLAPTRCCNQEEAGRPKP
nr:unnamed protein product [Digitaria exilis]